MWLKTLTLTDVILCIVTVVPVITVMSLQGTWTTLSRRVFLSALFYQLLCAFSAASGGLETVFNHYMQGLPLRYTQAYLEALSWALPLCVLSKSYVSQPTLKLGTNTHLNSWAIQLCVLETHTSIGMYVCNSLHLFELYGNKKIFFSSFRFVLLPHIYIYEIRSYRFLQEQF